MNDPALVSALAQRGFDRVQAAGIDPTGTAWYGAQQGDRPVQIAITSLRAGGWDAEIRFAEVGIRWRRLHHEGFPLYLEDFAVDTPSDRYFCRVTAAVPGSLLATGLDEAELRAVARGLLRAVAYLHNQKQVHGGIRPEIVRWGPQGVALTEIGGWDSPTVTALTASSGFLAPEQYRDATLASSDLFAVGATLIYAHTGRLLAELPQTDGVLDWEQALPQLSQEMQWWLTELVEPLPENRPRSAEAALAALVDRDLALVAAPPSRRWRVRKTSRAFEATCRQDVLDLVIHYPLTILAFAVLALAASARLGPFSNFLLGVYGVVWAGTVVLAGGNFGDIWGDGWRKFWCSAGLALSFGGTWLGVWSLAIFQKWPGCQPRTPWELLTCAPLQRAAPLIYIAATLWIGLVVASEAPPKQVRYRFDDQKYTLQHRRGGLLGWLGLHRRLHGDNHDIQDLTASGGGIFLVTKKSGAVNIAPRPLWARDRRWLIRELRHFLYIERQGPPPP